MGEVRNVSVLTPHHLPQPSLQLCRCRHQTRRRAPCEPAVRADAHKNACARDVARVEDRRPVVELAKQGFDLAEPRIDLLGQFVRVFIFAVDLAQALGVTSGEVGRGLCLQPLGHDRIGRGGIGEPAAIIRLERIAQHRATGRFLGVEPDEHGAAVRRTHRLLSQHVADLIGRFGPGAPKRLPDLFLPCMIDTDRGGHQLIRRHANIGVDVGKPQRDTSEAPTLLHHMAGDDPVDQLLDCMFPGAG